MVLNKVQEGHLSGSSAKPGRVQRDIPRAQETIYNYLLEIVKEWSPEEVLEEFRRLFIHHVNTVSSHTLPSLYEIVFANQEEEFRNTLKRSCYILINNWDLRRNHTYIQQLIKIFEDPILEKPSMSPTLRRLRGWLQNFVQSDDFQQLKLFAARYDTQVFTHWSERYTSYLLVPQYIDLRNSAEQRHAARALSKQLKEKFKFDLAFYTAHSANSTVVQTNLKNPTTLGDNVLRLVKMIVARQGRFSYTNLANIFLRQTQNLRYADFKRSLRKYLLFSINNQEFVKTLTDQLSDRLTGLYVDYHDKNIDDALLLRTCNRVIEYLTTENHREPSPLFIQILSHGNPLLLVVLLLKLVLVCRYARTHLEARIADLVKYYKDYSEEECKWVIHFFEIFDITMAIYAENVEFNLISMQGASRIEEKLSAHLTELDQYRIFSQMRGDTEEGFEIENLETALLEVLSEEQSSDSLESD